MKPSQIISYPDATFRSAALGPNPLVGGEAVAQAEKARTLARQLSAQAFPNIGDYKYVYLTAGATEAIDFLVTKQPFSVQAGEYRYVHAHSPVPAADTKYLSYPFSGTGSRTDIPTNVPVILDCSYIFAVAQPASPPLPANVKHVIFSLSKSHNLYDARCGWFFTNTIFPGLHTLQYEYGYISALTVRCLEAAATAEPNLLYKRFQDEFSALYARSGLREAETNLFALSPGGERVPYYECRKP